MVSEDVNGPYGVIEKEEMSDLVDHARSEYLNNCKHLYSSQVGFNINIRTENISNTASGFP